MKRGLCIGINNYGGGSNLAGCVNDANDWAAKLASMGYAVTRLLDAAATGDGIRVAIANVLATSKRGDHVVITYSGHGSYVYDESGDEPDGLDECWCGHDIITSERGILTDDELGKLLADRAAGIRVAVFSDSCHSGSMTRQFELGNPEIARRRIRFIHPSDFLRADQVAKMGTGRAFAPRSCSVRAAWRRTSSDASFSDRASSSRQALEAASGVPVLTRRGSSASSGPEASSGPG